MNKTVEEWGKELTETNAEYVNAWDRVVRQRETAKEARQIANLEETRLYNMQIEADKLWGRIVNLSKEIAGGK